MTQDIALGDKVKDSITRFIGVATAKTEYMSGCVHYEVTPVALKDGCPQKAIWIDAVWLSVVEKAKKSASLLNASRRKGGPGDHHKFKRPEPTMGCDEEGDY
ncbi:MAG: hypothetical protein J3T61_12865 [Candidatus Brocadiales bacterium]|nr:hypothetical protein [Candidatus Bathyanammoxibius sp.]